MNSSHDMFDTTIFLKTSETTTQQQRPLPTHARITIREVLCVNNFVFMVVALLHIFLANLWTLNSYDYAFFFFFCFDSRYPRILCTRAIVEEYIPPFQRVCMIASKCFQLEQCGYTWGLESVCSLETNVLSFFVCAQETILCFSPLFPPFNSL